MSKGCGIVGFYAEFGSNDGEGDSLCDVSWTELEEERLARLDRNLEKALHDAWLRAVFDDWRAEVFPPALELMFLAVAGVA